MQLNELIDKESIEAVSQKTNISVENLTSLYEQDFEKLNRVKALGFLKIFEREYESIEVESLREAIKEYYSSHKKDKDDEVVMVTQSMKDERGGGFGFLKWLIIVGILYGVWHLYNAGKLGSFSSSEESGSQLSDRNALKSGVSETVTENIHIKENGSNGKTIEIETKAVEVKQAEGSIEESVEKVVLTETNATVESITETNVSKSTQESVLTAQKSDNNATVTSDEANDTVTTEENNATVAIENLTINPTRGMLWYGFINIDTKQRREFMNKVSTPFEVNGGRWILVTGHGYVDIVSEAKTIEIADKVKHYFYIDSNEIREIDRKEFRELNGGRGW